MMMKTGNASGHFNQINFWKYDADENVSSMILCQVTILTFDVIYIYFFLISFRFEISNLLKTYFIFSFSFFHIPKREKKKPDEKLNGLYCDACVCVCVSVA